MKFLSIAFSGNRYPSSWAINQGGGAIRTPVRGQYQPMSSETEQRRSPALWATDYYRLDDTLSPAEREIRDRVRRFSDHEVVPIINAYWEKAEFPFDLIPKLAELRIAGTTTKGYGCPGMSRLAGGLVSRELSRG